jgi:methyl-accepting chemotaxis protein
MNAQQIAAAAQQQSLAIDQIADAMKEINSAAESFVVGAIDAKAAAARLNATAEDLQTRTASYRLVPESELDKRMLRLTQEGARRFEELFEEAVALGELTLEDLFDDNYQPILGSNPKQYRTRHCDFTDRVAPPVQEPILEADEVIGGCCLHDRNGYRPTMNLRFSEPQRDDPEWNAKHARAKTIVSDDAGLAASRNTEPYLLQIYPRTASGVLELSKDLSVPIFVRGRHWGSLRTVYVEPTE